MKKTIIFLIFIFLFTLKVEAGAKFYVDEKIEDVFIEYHSGERAFNDNSYILRREDGKVVYCLNPWRKLNQTDYYNEYYYNDSRFNISDDTLKMINLYAYYGYNYPGHEDSKWYAVTQFLIWDMLGLDDLFFTDTRYGNRIYPFNNEIEEIKNLMRNHDTLPVFSNLSLEYVGENNYNETDTNNVLNNYAIYDSNIDSSIDGNELIINTHGDGDYYIKFKRKREMNNNYVLYGLDGYQEVIDPGGIEDIYFSVNVSVNSGEIIIEKKDSENLKRKDASLEGAIYVITKDGKEVERIYTNEDGIASINYLPMGEYLVYELKPSLGYNIDSNVYYVNITKDNKTSYIKSFEDVIKGNMKIIKYYGENQEYELEDSAIFEIYDKHDNLVNTYETKEGLIEDTLDYGTYYLKQIKGIEGYELIDRFDFNINESKEYIFNLYNNRKELIVDVPDTKVNSPNFSLIFIILGLVLIIVSRISKNIN